MCSKCTFYLDGISYTHPRSSVARDYVNVVEGFPFSSTLVAPNASYSASDMSGLSVNTVDQLFEASSEVIVSTTVPFVGLSHIVSVE
jgi:hypothetical protein